MERAVRLLDQLPPHRELDRLTELLRVSTRFRWRNESGYQLGVNSSPVSSTSLMRSSHSCSQLLSSVAMPHRTTCFVLFTRIRAGWILIVLLWPAASV